MADHTDEDAEVIDFTKARADRAPGVRCPCGSGWFKVSAVTLERGRDGFARVTGYVLPVTCNECGKDAPL